MNRSADWKAYLALIIVCIVWGTTYLANKYGVQEVDPLFFAGTRMIGATIIMALLFFRKFTGLRLDRRVWRDQCILGFLLITLGNGVGTASLLYLDSGVASVFATLSPMVIVILNLILRWEGYLKPWGYAGMLLATSGCTMMFVQDIDFYGSKNGLLGLGLFGLCLLAWALGSLLTKRMKSSGNALMDSTLQMFTGGCMLLLLSTLLENPSFSQFQMTQWWALIYTIIVGSIITYNAYIYALSKLPTTIVSIHSYINPLIALYVGHIFLGERWDKGIWASTFLILCGVFLISRHFVRKIDTDQ